MDRRAPRSLQEARFGAWAAASAAVLFGSAIVATAFQLRSFTPTSAAMWRGGVGALLLVVLILIQRVRSRGATRTEPLEPAARWARRWRLLVLGALSGPIFIVGMNIAVAEVGSTITGFVVALYSIFSAAIAPLLLNEPLRGRSVAGLVSALVGTGLLAQLSLSDTSVWGMAAGLGAAVSYGFYLVLGRRWLRPLGIRPEQTALWAAVMTALVVLAWLAAIEPQRDRAQPVAARRAGSSGVARFRDGGRADPRDGQRSSRTRGDLGRVPPPQPDHRRASGRHRSRRGLGRSPRRSAGSWSCSAWRWRRVSLPSFGDVREVQVRAGFRTRPW